MKKHRIVTMFLFLALIAPFSRGQETPPVMSPDKPIMGRLAIEAVEKLKIRCDALGKDAYFAINHYALSPRDENVYLLDAKDFVVHVFDPSGRQVRAIRIRKGQGPGEFGGGFPLLLAAYPREEGLWVEDNEKLALFDPQGGVISEKEKESGYSRILGLSPQSLLAITDEFGPFSDPDRARSIVQRFQLEDWDEKPLAVFLTSDKTGGWGNAWLNRVKDERITPLILFDYASRNKKIVYAVSDDYALFVKDLTGNTLLTIRRTFVPRKITGEMRRVILGSPYFQQLASMTKANGQDFQKMMDMNQRWEHLNPIIGLQFLDNGFICVFVLKDVHGGFEADLFDPRGQWQATLQFPDAVQKLTEPRLQGNRLAGLVVDNEDGELAYVEFALKNLPEKFIR